MSSARRTRTDRDRTWRRSAKEVSDELFVESVLQASELLPQIADEKYPGPGGALVSLCWSPFAVEKNAIVLASSNPVGLKAGVEALCRLLKCT